MIPKTGNKNVDTAITVGVIVLLVIIIGKLAKLFSNPIGTIQNELGITPDTNLPDANMNVNTAGLTHPVEQFEIWAAELYSAIWGFVADKQTIRDIMYQINSDDDLKLIIKTYGVQTSLLGLIGGAGLLVEHLRDVMNETDIAGFNSHYAGYNMKLRI